MDQTEINELFPTLGDGTFRIQVSRDPGDTYVAPTGSAIIDGVYASDVSMPETSSESAMTAGLGAIAGLLLARKQSSARA